MRTAFKWCLLLLNSLAFLGCASTAEDFQNMSLPERQAAVCYGSDAFEQRKQQLSFYEEEITNKQNVLNLGYRIHTQCRTVKIKAPPPDCSGYSTDMGKSTCQGTAWTRDSWETQCTETPVSIDPRYEQETIDEYRQTYSDLSSSHSELTQQCFTRISEMPPEAAYIYYSEDMEPRASGASTVDTKSSAENPMVVSRANTSQPPGYAGQMKDGVRHGVGTQSYGNGDKYNGHWRDGMRHGKGTYFYKDGRVYEGSWVKGKLDGYVTQTFLNGEIYEGFMKQDQYDGYGVLTCADGSSRDLYHEEDKLITGTFCPRS